ncbi:hypothetical protein FRC00_000043 [Tulasnella sp. 408]|nr:hypothetical protein FRC00_000043 [Tulasnella sp. 408]
MFRRILAHFFGFTTRNDEPSPVQIGGTPKGTEITLAGAEFRPPGCSYLSLQNSSILLGRPHTLSTASGNGFTFAGPSNSITTMKSILATGSLVILLLASSTGDAIFCPQLVPAKSPNTLAASALPGYYLDAGSDGSVKLVEAQNLVALRYGSNAPLSLWITPPFSSNTCPGYRYLNAAASTGAVGYENLTWDATPVTYWNATTGNPLSTIVNGVTVSRFIACKPVASIDSSYLLFLQTGSASTITGAPSSVDTTTCVTTKIVVI